MEIIFRCTEFLLSVWFSYISYLFCTINVTLRITCVLPYWPTTMLGRTLRILNMCWRGRPQCLLKSFWVCKTFRTFCKCFERCDSSRTARAAVIEITKYLLIYAMGWMFGNKRILIQLIDRLDETFFSLQHPPLYPLWQSTVFMYRRPVSNGC